MSTPATNISISPLTLSETRELSRNSRIFRVSVPTSMKKWITWVCTGRFLLSRLSRVLSPALSWITTNPSAWREVSVHAPIQKYMLSEVFFPANISLTITPMCQALPTTAVQPKCPAGSSSKPKKIIKSTKTNITFPTASHTIPMSQPMNTMTAQRKTEVFSCLNQWFSPRNRLRNMPIFSHMMTNSPNTNILR